MSQLQLNVRMLIPLLCAVTAGLLYAFAGTTYKWAENNRCRPAAFLFTFMLTAGLVTLTKALFEPTTWQNPLLWVLGIVAGLLTYVAVQFTIRATALGPASVVWIVINLSLVVPIALAPVLFHEPFLVVDIVLLALFGLMLLAFNHSMSREPAHQPVKLPAFLLALGIAFLFDGLCLMCTKYTFIWFGHQNTAGMPAITFLSAAAYGLTVYLRQEGCRQFQPAELKIGLTAGLLCSCGFMSFLMAMSLPSMVSFPIVKGLSLMGGGLLVVLFFKEPLRRGKIIGLLLGLGVLFLAACRESVSHWMNQMLHW